MALLAIIRRLRFHGLTPVMCLSQSSHSLALQFTSFTVPPASFSFSQAFHRTPYRQFEHVPDFGSLSNSQDQSLYQIYNFDEYVDESREDIQFGLGEFLERVRKAKDFASGDEAIAFLDDSGVKPDKDFIFAVIWALREEWKLAYLVFKWGEKWDCVIEKTWCLMIWLLGNHKKFSTAWTLIHELYHDSKDTQQAMLLMIDRYAAANHPEKAIHTFHMLQKFKFSPERKAYFTFLSILCKHGNVEEAEEFMYLNKKFFPLETESFNIILNSWCNISIDITEAKRVWREMSKCCIEPNEASYTHLISCFSNVGNLFDSLRLYDEMKKRGWVPGVGVYHSLIYILTRENCLSDALKIVDGMIEKGVGPTSTTYNLIIRPLCEAGKFEEARSVLARMMGDRVIPTIDTYHALMKGENLVGVLGLLDHMRKAGLGPNGDTFVIILDNFFKTGQWENALKIWLEMKKYDVKASHVHYNVLVKGLVNCGLIAKAREFYFEMTSVGMRDDPSLRKLLEEPVCARKGRGEMKVVRNVKQGQGLGGGKIKVVKSGRRREQ